MLAPVPKSVAERHHGVITDDGLTLCFSRGRFRVIDGVRIPRSKARGAIVAPNRHALIEGRAFVLAEGDLRIVAVDRARVRCRHGAIVARTHCRAHIIAEAETDGQCFESSTFEARENARITLHHEASGDAYDETVITLSSGWTGVVRVHPQEPGQRPLVAIVPPPDMTPHWTESQDGVAEVRLIRLAA